MAKKLTYEIMKKEMMKKRYLNKERIMARHIVFGGTLGDVIDYLEDNETSWNHLSNNEISDFMMAILKSDENDEIRVPVKSSYKVYMRRTKNNTFEIIYE